MKTIWKFPLAVRDEQTVTMPDGAELLHVYMQGDEPFLWALVNPGRTKCQRTVRIYGTGHPVPDEPGRYLGTFQMYAGQLVFHAFDPAGAS